MGPPVAKKFWSFQIAWWKTFFLFMAWDEVDPDAPTRPLLAWLLNPESIEPLTAHTLACALTRNPPALRRAMGWLEITDEQRLESKERAWKVAAAVNQDILEHTRDLIEAKLSERKANTDLDPDPTPAAQA